MNQSNNSNDLSIPAPSRHAVLIVQNDTSFTCSSEESLLQGMTKIGKKGIPVGCLNGGCGVCKIIIHSGDVKKSGPMSRAHISEQDEAQGVVLACRVTPLSDIQLEVTGCIKKRLGA